MYLTIYVYSSYIVIKSIATAVHTGTTRWHFHTDDSTHMYYVESEISNESISTTATIADGERLATLYNGLGVGHDGV